MGLEITETEREGVVILALKGRLTMGESNLVREKVSQLIAEGKLNIVFDLADCDFIDSTGLGDMVICYTTLKRAGGALKLLNLNKRNIELLLLTKLTTIFEVFGEEREAVNSFFPDRGIKHFDILSFVQEQQKEG
jgi:anti-sigma B factor antagonist